MTDTTITLDASGLVQVYNVGHLIGLRVMAGLGPGVPPVILTRDEAETVVKALTQALAFARAEDARPAAAEPLEGAVKRKAKA